MLCQNGAKTHRFHFAIQIPIFLLLFRIARCHFLTALTFMTLTSSQTNIIRRNAMILRCHVKPNEAQ